MYLETGWGDFIYSDSASKDNRDSCDPLRAYAKPDYYREIASLTAAWCDTCALRPKKYCDVGGSVGRMLYEIHLRFSSLERLCLVDPVPEFINWARRLLTGQVCSLAIPVIDKLGKAAARKPDSLPAPLLGAYKQLSFYDTAVEKAFKRMAHFDLITCLNVVDRHPDPEALIEYIRDLLVPRGLLILSSPLHFLDDIVPDKTKWVDDIKELLPEQGFGVVGESNTLFDVRDYRRRWTRYNCQVVGLIKAT